MKTTKTTLMILVFCLLLSCSNTMRGFTRENNEPVEFDLKDGKVGSLGDICVTLSDGERFEGRLSRHTVIGGTKGHTMECSFSVKTVQVSLATFVRNGRGICQVSDGRIIDIMYIGRKKGKWDGKTIEVKGEHNIVVLENNRFLYVPSGVIFKGTGTYHPRKRDEEGRMLPGKGDYWEIQFLE